MIHLDGDHLAFEMQIYKIKRQEKDKHVKITLCLYMQKTKKNYHKILKN